MPQYHDLEHDAIVAEHLPEALGAILSSATVMGAKANISQNAKLERLAQLLLAGGHTRENVIQWLSTPGGKNTQYGLDKGAKADVVTAVVNAVYAHFTANPQDASFWNGRYRKAIHGLTNPTAPQILEAVQTFVAREITLTKSHAAGGGRGKKGGHGKKTVLTADDWEMKDRKSVV